MKKPTIQPMIVDYVRAQRAGRAVGGRALLALFSRCVGMATRRYPSFYFPLGVRDDDALQFFTDELFFRCTSVAIGRRPYRDRTPFDTIVDDAIDEPEIFRLIFFHRYSLLMDLLKEQRVINLRADPALKQQRALWSELNRWLSDNADVDGRVGRHPRWRLRGQARGGDTLDALALQQALQDAGPAPAPVLAARALAMAGRPLTTAAILQLIGPLVEAPLSLAPPPEPPPMSPELRLDIHRVVIAVWEGLSEQQQLLLRAVAETGELAALQRRAPGYRRPDQITRAVKRIDALFVERLSAALGWTPREAGRPKPRTLYTLIHEVLLTVIRERTPLADPHHLFSAAEALPAPVEEMLHAMDAQARFDALFHPVLAEEQGLAGSTLAAIGAAAWAADPARALAEAELDEGMWAPSEAEIARMLDEL